MGIIKVTIFIVIMSISTLLQAETNNSLSEGIEAVQSSNNRMRLIYDNKVIFKIYSTDMVRRRFTIKETLNINGHEIVVFNIETIELGEKVERESYLIVIKKPNNKILISGDVQSNDHSFSINRDAIKEGIFSLYLGYKDNKVEHIIYDGVSIMKDLTIPPKNKDYNDDYCKTMYKVYIGFSKDDKCKNRHCSDYNNCDYLIEDKELRFKYDIYKNMAKDLNYGNMYDLSRRSCIIKNESSYDYFKSAVCEKTKYELSTSALQLLIKINYITQ